MVAPRSKTPPRWQGWLQFRLKPLFVLITVVCIGLGAYVERGTRHHRAVTSLHRAMVDVDHVEAPNCDEDPFADDEGTLRGRLRSLGPTYLRPILGIDLFGDYVAVVVHAGSDPDSALSCLRDLKGLRRVRFTRVTDADMESIAPLRGLDELDLSETAITDSGLTHLKHIDGLGWLNVEGSVVTDAGMGHVAMIRRLEALNVSHTTVGDAGLANLRPLATLKRLNLGNTQVTDACVEYLVELPALEWVLLTRTGVTVDGVAKLRTLRPNLKVEFYESEGECELAERAMVQGKWEEAIERWRRGLRNYLSSGRAWWPIARCHAELEQWDAATTACNQALDRTGDVHFLGRDYYPKIWRELQRWPVLLKRITTKRPDDPTRWIAVARDHVLHGRYSQAAPAYRRAVVDNPFQGGDLEYAACLLLAGDGEGYRRHCTRLTDQITRRLERLTEIERWLVGARLFLMGPNDSIDPVRLVEGMDVTRALADFQDTDVAACALYRAGRYEDALSIDETNASNCSVARCLINAMAHQRLGRDGKARECLRRAKRWLAREATICSVAPQRLDATRWLEAELLRREAEALVFVPKSR